MKKDKEKNTGPQVRGLRDKFKGKGEKQRKQKGIMYKCLACNYTHGWQFLASSSNTSQGKEKFMKPGETEIKVPKAISDLQFLVRHYAKRDLRLKHLKHL